jgi:hypothetical protein
MGGFDSRIDLWRMMAPAAVADLKRAARARASRAPERAAPTAASRTKVTAEIDPTEIDIPKIGDFVDPEDLAAKVVRAGQMSRGEIPIPAPTPSGVAAAIHAAGDLARAGGPSLPAPTGLAAQIIAAGEKRRRPMGE